MNPETIEKRSQTVIKFIVYKIEISTGNTIEKFNGYSEAANSVGTKKNSIWCACNGKTKTCKGFIWKSELKN